MSGGCSGAGAAGVCSGLTLVELMVSLLLGSLFSLAMAAVYLHSKRQFAQEDAMARMQENGRFALQLLRRELGHAGFYAGAFAVAEMPATAVSRDCVSSGNWALEPLVALEWVSDYGSSAPDPLRTGRGTQWSCLERDAVKAGTDLIAVKRTAGSPTLKQGEEEPAAVLKSGQWYLRVAEFGEQLSWFYHSTGGIPAADLGAGKRVDYWEFHTQIFYVRGYSETEGDGIPTLCVEGLGGGQSLGTMATRCLVEGVDDMQIELGFDSDFDGVPDYFRASSTPADGGPVVAARLYLLLRSIGPLPGHLEDRTYALGGKTVRHSDNYLRRVIGTTVQMRGSSGGVSIAQVAP